MTAQENLAWVIEAAWGNPTWDGSTLRPIDRTIADAVVAFLTSDEAVDRAAQAIWESGDAGESKIPWSEADTPEWPTARAEFRADARAAILAACGPVSLPGQPVLDAIHEAQAAVARGERAEVAVESLPLDPKPWKDQFGIKHSMEMHGENGTPVWKCEWAPDPGYEQRREFYEKGAE